MVAVRGPVETQRLGGDAEIPMAVGGVHGDLARLVAELLGHVDVAVGLEDEEGALVAIGVEAVGRALGDDDVVAFFEGQEAIDGFEHAAAVEGEPAFVALGV